MRTKGTMVKDLKGAGIRKAVKAETNELVSLEHLKEHQIIGMWEEHCNTPFYENKSHDASYFSKFLGE